MENSLKGMLVLGDGNTGIGEGVITLQDGSIAVGIMLRTGAGDGVIGSDLDPLDPNSYHAFLLSTNKEALLVLREQVDRAIEKFDDYVEYERNNPGYIGEMVRQGQLFNKEEK